MNSACSPPTPHLLRGTFGQFEMNSWRDLRSASVKFATLRAGSGWLGIYVSACPRSLPIEMVFNAEKDNAAERRLSFAASRQQEIGTVQQIALRAGEAQ